MTRRYADVVDVDVEVRTADSAGVPAVPTAFVWRGRVYVVRAVLGHWRERRAWWSGAAARALHGESGVLGPERADPERRARELAEEHEVWRVEASRGRSHGVGVYDLCTEPGDDPSTDRSAWRLLRVSD